MPRLEPAWRALAFILIAALAGLLYLPYLGNPLIFDDKNIFHTSVLTQAAIAPWEVGIRGLPYFTLGWMETQIGRMEVHRLTSLLLHILVAYNLFRFLEALLLTGAPVAESNAKNVWHLRRLALLVALLFACHPVAVYGAGYLVQRTILMATLFSLLCLRDLFAALEQGNRALAARAALWGSLAILCKEHAILLPFAALSLLMVTTRPLKADVRIAALFMALSMPAVIYAAWLGLYALGHAYEPALPDLESERFALPLFSDRWEKWLFSIFVQLQLYFQYWAQWLWPNPARMSIDLRVDFLRGWTPIAGWLSAIGFAALPIGACVVGLHREKGRLIAFALVFTAILAGVEFASVRFQEPYVLYRSYLWSIGYCTFFAALASLLPRKAGLALLVLAVPVLFYQASGRLDSFRSGRMLWEDAASKLSKLEVAGSSRILFNRGGERFKAGDINGAMSDIDQAINLAPKNADYRIARAVALLSQGKPESALEDVQFAKVLAPDNSNVFFAEYRVLSALGRKAEADISLNVAAKAGHYGAKYELARRLSKDGTVIVVN